jgi:hypothetical protein
MSNCRVNIDGFDADYIVDIIVSKVIQTLDLDKIKNEVKNVIAKELKNDIVTNERVQSAIQTAINSANVVAANRVQEAADKKIKEINSIDFSNLKLTITK